MPVDIISGDARHIPFPDKHFHCAVTSPPYWGLRDYGLEPVVWGPECEHEWGEESFLTRQTQRDHDGRDFGETGGEEPSRRAMEASQGTFCLRCNAWRGSLGLEPTPELYVQHLVEIFREVRRTLRDDATLWLNIGDSYAGSGKGRMGDGTHAAKHGEKQHTNTGTLLGKLPHGLSGNGLKTKDLVGIPWMVAFALRADGWYLRSDIIWHKPNAMPESVRDRPTKAHEYLFLLSKSKKYYYDKAAILEPAAWERWGKQTPVKIYRGSAIKARSKEEILEKFGGRGRNARTVWNIATQSYPGAHFAVFPEKLVEPCILAGCPKGGVVLDPFAGSGTVGVVAQRLGRSATLIDAKPEYCKLAQERIK